MPSKGFEAVATPDNVTVSAQTMHGSADDNRIDTWELKASRRILANLRHLLYREPMFNLINDQVEESGRLLKHYIKESHGEFSGTQVIVTAKELTVAQYGAYLKNSLGSSDGSIGDGLENTMAELKSSPAKGNEIADNQIFPMHPEHYTVPEYQGVIETMGGLPTRTRVQPIAMNEMPDYIQALADPEAPIILTGAGFLDDDSGLCYVLQQLKDSPEGLRIDLRIWYPSACPPEYLAEHAEHYTVEYRNGLRMAAAALKESGADQVDGQPAAAPGN